MLASRIANWLGRPFGINPFPRAFPNTMAGGLDRASTFDRIYTSNFWGSDESRSGVGSEASAASEYRDHLLELLTRIEARSIFDAPCGDLYWILPLTRNSCFHYSGGDVAAELVKDLGRWHPTVPVRVFDICENPFPAADVWHCRDCLFHLPFSDIRKALENFAASNIPYALLTTHRARLFHRNLDVAAGGFRYLDLERAPVSLPSAIEYLADYKRGTEFPRYVGLWRREDIQGALTALATTARIMS